MKETGMVPVFYHADLETAKSVLKACYEGGVRAFEFTNRGDFAHEVFGELVKYANKELPGMILGIGSVVDPATRRSLSSAWCQFRRGSSLQPGDRSDLQPPSCAVLPGMRNRIRGRQGTGTRPRPLQGLPWRCSRPCFCEGTEGSDALESDNGDWRSEADTRESRGLVQGWRDLRGYGQQPLPEGSCRFQRLGCSHQTLQRRVGYNKRSEIILRA